MPGPTRWPNNSTVWQTHCRTAADRWLKHRPAATRSGPSPTTPDDTRQADVDVIRDGANGPNATRPPRPYIPRLDGSHAQCRNGKRSELPVLATAALKAASSIAARVVAKLGGSHRGAESVRGGLRTMKPGIETPSKRTIGDTLEG